MRRGFFPFPNSKTRRGRGRDDEATVTPSTRQRESDFVVVTARRDRVMRAGTAIFI